MAIHIATGNPYSGKVWKDLNTRERKVEITNCVRQLVWLHINSLSVSSLAEALEGLNITYEQLNETLVKGVVELAADRIERNVQSVSEPI